MDVNFKTSDTDGFTIEVGFFDTVLEIKEKIHKYQGIPVAAQTLVFDGRVLSDDLDIDRSQLVEGSRVHLLLDADPDNPSPPPPPPPPQPAMVRITLKVAATKRQHAVEIEAGETVARLKERVQELEGIPAGRCALVAGATEMQDGHAVAEYGVGEGSEVGVVMRAAAPPQSSPAAAGAAGGRRLRLTVLAKGGAQKAAVEVNAWDNVSELRKELQRLQGRHHFQLPAEDYFFIYKQNVMDDDRTFRWHDVRNGDTIEIFIGSVTAGS